VGEAVKAKNEKCLTRAYCVRARAKSFTLMIPLPTLRPLSQQFRLRARAAFPASIAVKNTRRQFMREKSGAKLCVSNG